MKTCEECGCEYKYILDHGPALCELTRLRRDVLAERAKREEAERNYYTLCDAVCRESKGVEDACNQARAERARSAALQAEVERMKVALFDLVTLLGDLEDLVERRCRLEVATASDDGRQGGLGRCL